MKAMEDVHTEKNICELVDEDIAYAEAVWNASSYDTDALEVLFYRLTERYKDRIDGFSRGLQILQIYESPAELAELYRENIRMLLERLRDFRENGYSNEGLQEYYISKDWQEMHLDMDFTAVRLEIGMLELSAEQFEDIAEHLNDMEAICARVTTQKEKWNGLREHLVWLSGQEVDVAI
ncbi:MAG: hypothetical protein IKA89_05865, partial [Anaerotignum sp.]|nr:hypothetical protein [Anaerotignum sp.]